VIKSDIVTHFEWAKWFLWTRNYDKCYFYNCYCKSQL